MTVVLGAWESKGFSATEELVTQTKRTNIDQRERGRVDQQTAGFLVAQALRGRDLQLFSVSIQFPIKVIIRKAKCRQINRFQSFIQSFPSFGRNFDCAPTVQESKVFIPFGSLLSEKQIPRFVGKVNS